MNPTEISLLNALLNLFYNLRDFGLPLGIDDYLLAMEAVQGGFGIRDRQSLEQLCCILWTKSKEEARLLHRLLDQVLAQVDIEVETSPTVEPSPTQESSNSSLSEISSTKPEQPVDTPAPPPAEDTFNSTTNSSTESEEENVEISQEPEQVIQAIRHNKRESLITIYPYPNSTDQYLPVTGRQIKQSWRILRRPIRKGKLEELDVAATVEKISQQGIVIEPIFKPRYVNCSELVLLVDQGGSMTPFHHLSRQLIEKAQQGGNITRTRVYYFHNYPEKYIYTDPTRLKAQLLNEVLQSIDQKAAVLIVSDAGAARGNYNAERVKESQNFIKQLQQFVRYFAWLNPMPNESWQYTTAGEIALLVPMFEMSRQGLNAAINTLRGRYVYWERPYQWMLS
ncbi:hypothetical protein B4U84_07945 [Westiellopsis prolifica IICB1]|nr:hypothetical protein B4U84_07945 [Westiellopsis prolifica IICB1]